MARAATMSKAHTAISQVSPKQVRNVISETIDPAQARLLVGRSCGSKPYLKFLADPVSETVLERQRAESDRACNSQ